MHEKFVSYISFFTARFIAQLVEKQEQQQQQGRFQATKMDDDVVITGVTQRANSNPMSGESCQPFSLVVKVRPCVPIDLSCYNH